MDPLKLLSRSTKFNRSSRNPAAQPTPSSGQTAQPQLYPEADSISRKSKDGPGKRKRDSNDDKGKGEDDQEAGINFFTQASDAKPTVKRTKTHSTTHDLLARKAGSNDDTPNDHGVSGGAVCLDDRKRILTQHKLKVTWLNASPTAAKTGKKSKKANKSKKSRISLYPEPLEDFKTLQVRHGVPKSLVAELAGRGYTIPTEVQLAALPLLLDGFANMHSVDEQHKPVSTPTTGNDGSLDLLTVAPTGSGKTLAFLIPILHGIQKRRRDEGVEDKHTSAIVLAPTKELVAQTVNEGRKLAKNSSVKITQARKGMRLGQSTRDNGGGADGNEPTTVKSDILVSTPGLLQSLVDGDTSARVALSTVRYLVLDEADVLLDPLFRDQTLAIWNALSNPALRVSLWSATMGSNIEEMAQETIADRRDVLSAQLGYDVSEAPLVRLVVGLKDSAVPNVEHKLIYAATEQGKLMGLRQLLHPTSTKSEAGPPMRPPFLIFTQTIERAIALHSELLYDIPVEAGGINRIAVLHSDLSDAVRDSIMTRFRKGEVWVLITTDLLSRGVDFRGINGVVNYDMPTSSAAYVHRVGRTGRAGRRGGVAVTLYSDEDIPYLKHVANVVSMAQGQNGGEGGMQKWLLDALPKLSKNEKKNLKKHGIESRTARGKEKDPKAARMSRISTKAGYVRREDNRRKGAIEGSRRRIEAGVESDEGEETDFGGFD